MAWSITPPSVSNPGQWRMLDKQVVFKKNYLIIGGKQKPDWRLQDGADGLIRLVLDHAAASQIRRPMNFLSKTSECGRVLSRLLPTSSAP